MALNTRDRQPQSLKEALEDIAQLKEQNAQLNNELEDCQDRLLELLQKENDVPEQALKQEFIRIFDSIEAWIDDVSGDENFEFDDRWNSRIENNHLEQLILSLGLDESCNDPEWLEKLRVLGTCHYVVLSLVIARCLMEDIFRYNLTVSWGDIYPLSLEEDVIEGIVEMQDVMASDALRRGQQSLAFVKSH
jgi:hypothetical protein